MEANCEHRYDPVGHKVEYAGAQGAHEQVQKFVVYDGLQNVSAYFCCFVRF